MAAEVPTRVPEQIVAGNTLKFTIDLEDYRPGDGWQLSYHFLNASADLGQHDGTDNGDGTHLVTVDASTTAGWAAGRYSYRAFVSKGTERFSAGEGELVVEPDFATVATYDGRTHARKVLDSVEALLEGKATKDQASYTVQGRALQRYSFEELLKLRDRLRQEVQAEEDAARIASGDRPRTKVLGRFAVR